jgi:imidazolonepropionase-like amidohydrolase
VHDGTIESHHAVRIEQGKIHSIGDYKALKKNIPPASQIDCKGKFLIPGLWDMHVHLEGAELIPDNELLLPVFLAYGITTVRDCASDLGLRVLQWRDEIKDGQRIGPTIYTAGRKLEGKNSIWKGDLEIENEDELRAMLDTLDRDRVDFVKITENTLQGDLFLKSVKAAHARGYRVSGHVPIEVTIEELVSAGYTSVEHASYLLRLGGDEPAIQSDLRSGKINKAQADAQYTATFDQARAIEQYKKLGARGLFVCPTLIGSYQLTFLKDTDHSHDEFLKYLTNRFVSNYEWRIQRMANETPTQLQQRKERLELLKKQLPLMQQAGIQLMAGSDAAALNTYVYPAESLLQELEIFQKAGLTPLQILQSATLAGARYFNTENETSSIEPGKRADLVLLNENPLKDAHALRSVNGVIAQGRLYDRKQLDNFLEEAHQKKMQLDQQRK